MSKSICNKHYRYTDICPSVGDIAVKVSGINFGYSIAYRITKVYPDGSLDAKCLAGANKGSVESIHVNDLVLYLKKKGN